MKLHNSLKTELTGESGDTLEHNVCCQRALVAVALTLKSNYKSLLLKTLYSVGVTVLMSRLTYNGSF